MQIENPKSKIANGDWLPDMDLNHDKQIQSLLCYRYTIGQTSAFKVELWRGESRLVLERGCPRAHLAIATIQATRATERTTLSRACPATITANAHETESCAPARQGRSA